MPICIACSTPVRNLYTTYSKADDRSLGKGVRLTQCPKCKRFADKYVEHDYVVLFIDLVLIKPQVYRHLLFNRLGRTDDRLDPSILRLGILLVLFDVYITWSRIEKSNAEGAGGRKFAEAPILTQYLFFLTLNTASTVAQHLTIRLLAGSWARWKTSSTNTARSHMDADKDRMAAESPAVVRQPVVDGDGLSSPNVSHRHQNSNVSATSLGESAASPTARTPRKHQHQKSEQSVASNATTGPASTKIPALSLASSSAISTALLVSSCTKLFPILLVIWPTTGQADLSDADVSVDVSSSFAHRATSYIGWIVLLNNIEALLILLDRGYAVATGLAISGIVARWIIEGWLLGMVGLVRDGGGALGDGPVGDVLRIAAWIGSPGRD